MGTRLLAASALSLLTFGVQANPLSDPVRSKSPSEQKTIFAELLHDSGKPCGRVTHLVYKGQDQDNQAYWAAACSNGESWNVGIPEDPNANARLLECSILEATTGLGCFDEL